jgi:XTP/dITP diphosphohydrolase
LDAERDVVLLATRSPDKIREIRQILGKRRPAVTLEEAGLARSAEEESVEAFDTFTANAIAKALFFHRRSGLATLADDSGLCVDALGGAPGVRSRRFAADTGARGRDLDLANNRRLLDRLASVPDGQRTARYVCAAAFVYDATRPPAVALGSVMGFISHEPRGCGGFGYDPLFLLPYLQRSFGELDATTKHALSHRGRAMRAIASILR